MKDIDNLLATYDLGDPKYKPDVIKQMEEIKIKREMMEKKQMEQMQFLNKINNHNNPNIQNIQNNQNKEQQTFQIIQNLILENNALKEKVKYLEDKMSQLIKTTIDKKIEDKNYK
jgi:hypothetical protein